MKVLSSTTSIGREEGQRRFFGRIIQRIDSRYSLQPLDGLTYWRERILAAILTAGGGLSLLALIPAVYLALARHLWVLLFADGTALFLTGYLLFASGQSLRFRARLTLSVTFSVGVIIIQQIGFLSGGTAWLFCFSVLSGVLLGLRAAITATLLNGVALVVLAGFSNSGHPLEQEFLKSLGRSVTAGVNFLFLNVVSAASVATLVNGLQRLNRETERATADLQAERKALILTKEKLKQEIAVRRESEKTLQRRERQYRTLAESIRDVIWTMDLEFRFTYISPAARVMQGWTVEELLEMPLGDILTPESLNGIYQEFQKETAIAVQTGSYHRSTTLELELLHKDGNAVSAEVTASFLLDENGRPVGILGVTRDITERKKAQREKEKLLESLNQSKKMEAIGQLAGGVAHDLNNVLSGIVSYPDLLLLDLPAESPLRKPIETIQESGKRAAAIVQDLLTLARRGVSVSEVVNLNKVVQDYLISPEFQRMKSFHPLVTITTRLDPELLNVLGSPVHLSKTIMNLVSNAAEAMPAGGEIRITSRHTFLDRPVSGYAEVRAGEYTVLEIADTGIGISPEDISRIYEPFYTKKKMGRSGTGLGMSVVWGTVEDHQGYIDIQSASGKGTTVTLYLPGTRQEAAFKATPNPMDQYRGEGEIVLVVDDLKEQRVIATRILTQLGYGARSVASGEEALDFIRREKADLIVLDMIMDRGIDGLSTFEQILRYNPRQRAIIASGFAESERVKKTQQLGAGAFLRKPYTVEALAKAVKAELAPRGEMAGG
jgi:two-component system cell cycle sensor histidine kinase/response regulator CckA